MSERTIILIGYDDHTSTYSVCDNLIERLMDCETADEANDMITEHGEYVGCEYEADLFLDVSNHDIEEFSYQLGEYIDGE